MTERQREDVTMRPLVSVVVITYNSEKTVAETLDSIAAQTYDNIEIVVADDCSTDNTIDIVNGWMTAHSDLTARIVSTEKNSGIAANCNNGVRAASGEYIKLLAGDDVLFPAAIEQFLEPYENEPFTDTVYQSRVKVFGNNNERVTGLAGYCENCCQIIRSNSTAKKQYRKIIGRSILVAPAVGLIHRSIYEKIGYYDERFPMLEDYPFYCKLLASGIKIAVIEKELVGYRASDGSVSGQMSKRYARSLADFFFKDRIFRLIKKGRFLVVGKQILQYGIMRYKIKHTKGDRI